MPKRPTRSLYNAYPLPLYPPALHLPTPPTNLSLSTTPSSNLIKNTVFPGHISPPPPLCALTPALIPHPSQTPSITPATYAAQFNWLISLGTLIYVLTSGSLSEIIYSLALVEECSIASAGRPNKCLQRGPWRNCSRGNIRVGRGGGGRGGSRYNSNGSRRRPRG